MSTTPNLRTSRGRLALDEESKMLLRRIVESMGRRQLTSINTLGHCLKFIAELETKADVAAELDLSLRLFRQVRTLYGELGWKDIESAVRDRLDDIPYPDSRLEFGVAYYVTGLAEGVAMQSYVDSSCADFAAIARSHVEAAARRPEPSRFYAYCEDATNRPQAQQFLDRWVDIGRRSFGQPGSDSDARAVELELRSHSNAQMLADFEERLRPLVERCGLALPAAR